MTRTLLLSLLLAAPVGAQTHARVAVGLGSAGLGDARLAFDTLVEGFGQVAPGLAAQRAYPVWWLVEADARRAVGGIEVGARAQGRLTQADALYGDYAGTVDVVGRTSAFIGEAEVAFPIGDMPLRAALHAGAVVLATTVTADAVATVDGRTETVSYRLEGTGLGPTGGASLLLDVPVGPAALSARLGARWGRVESLRATERTPTSQTDGELALGHGLSGLSLTVGVGF